MQVNATELEARCLALLHDVAATGEPLTITKRGKALARLVPATDEAPAGPPMDRIRLGLPLRDWLEYALSPPAVRLCPIPPAVAAESAALSDALSGDPADRRIVSTARLHGATLRTSDRRIIRSGGGAVA